MNVIDMWGGKAPFEVEDGFHPTLSYYPAENKRSRGAVVICPGGAYFHRAAHEGEGYAKFLNELGIDAFVVNYRVRHSEEERLFPAPQLDARRAIRYVRSHAQELGIDTEKIAIMGSSAGGHLAASISSYRERLDGEGDDPIDSVDFMPNLSILCYPVTEFASHNGSYKILLRENSTDFNEMCEKLNPIAGIDEKTPPTFIWHTAEDASVKIISTYKYVTKLKECGVPCELHVYPYGRHGLGLEFADEHVRSWGKMLGEWLEINGFFE